MKAVVITIGDEILIGQIVDTNSQFIAKSLDEIGYEVTETVSISDKKKAIRKALKRYQNKVDLVVITGGLGPTKDDVTKKAFCDYFEDELVLNDQVYLHVKKIIEDFYKRPISPENKNQALVPTRAAILFNEVGTAPGMLMQKEQTTYVSLPGVPFEMKYLVKEKLMPYLIREGQLDFNVHRTIITQGVGESLLAERIAYWEDHLPEKIHLSYLPAPGMVRLRLSVSGQDKNALTEMIDTEVAKLQQIIADCIISLDDSEPIEFVLSQNLTRNRQTIACAESCTGGKIAGLLTAIEGASKYFKGGVVTYATESKIDVLGVSRESIEKYSVVSEQVAIEMAVGAKKIFGSDYAVSTTGNAGPLKGDSEAEVGTVCIAVAGPNEVFVKTFNFGQPREKVLNAAVNSAIDMVLKEILKNNK